jgi:hypothetical protein
MLSKLNGLTEQQVVKEPYPYYDGDEINWDWDLTRSEGLFADVDRFVPLCERNRQITAQVDPSTTITTKRGRE